MRQEILLALRKAVGSLPTIFAKSEVEFVVVYPCETSIGKAMMAYANVDVYTGEVTFFYHFLEEIEKTNKD